MIQVNPATATSRQASGLNEDVIQAKASDMFKPIITFMKVCGTYSERGNPQKCKLCSYHFGYCIVINVVVILFGFKYFSVFRKGYDNTYKMVGLVTFAYFYCCVSCFCVIYLFHNCKYLTVIMTAFDKYGMDYGTCLNISVFNKRMKILIIIISGLLLFMIVCAMPVFVHYEEHQMLAKSHLAPFDESTGLIYYIAGFLNSLYSMENYCILISNSVFQLTFLHIIKNEFSSIAKEVKKNVFIQDFDRLFSLRRHHESLCELINIGNPILQQNAAFLYVYGIPIICLMLYGVTTGSVDMVDVLTMSMFIGLSVIEVFVVTIMGAQLCESAHEPFQDLFKVDVSKMTQSEANQLQMFISRLSGPNIGVSVYGLFVIDNSTILMMLGTIISYAVLVIQVNLIPTTCIPMATNVTGT